MLDVNSFVEKWISMYDGSSIENAEELKNTKRMLKQYRDVVLSKEDQTFDVIEQVDSFGNVTFVEAMKSFFKFGYEMDNKELSSTKFTQFEIQWIKALFELSMDKLYTYPENGKLYYEIINKQYFSNSDVSDNEMSKMLGIVRSTYFRKKKKAIEMFTVCLWVCIIPELVCYYYSKEFSLSSFYNIFKVPTNSRQ